MKSDSYFTRVTKTQLQPLIGNPIKGLKLKGSTAYFVKSIAFNGEEDFDLKNYKGVFESYSHGVLLMLFKSDKRKQIPINFQDIRKVNLIEGQLLVEPGWLTPMRLLLRLGVSLKIARYFQTSSDDVEKVETNLKIVTKDFDMKLLTNGFTFSSQKKFFESLNIGDKLEVVQVKPLVKY